MSELNSESVSITPTELITNKTLYTLTGASASVWIVCLVVHSFMHKTVSNPDIYKMIALSISLLISISMIIEKKSRKYKDWLLGIINGFLIFIYATGFNSISSNIFISPEEKSGTVEKSATSRISRPLAEKKLAGIFEFFEIDWFPDKKLSQENSNLKQSVDSLNKLVTVLAKPSSVATNDVNTNLLMAENNELKNKIHELENNNNRTTVNIASNTQCSEKDILINRMTHELNEYKRINQELNNNNSQELAALRTELRNLKNATANNQSNLDLLREIEKWKNKYRECFDNKQER
jgi:hypothetical protein